MCREHNVPEALNFILMSCFCTLFQPKIYFFLGTFLFVLQMKCVFIKTMNKFVPMFLAF
jgi:hypothetical protein